MAKLPYMPFYPADYQADTRCLSLAARGAWVDILCALWKAPLRGKRCLSLEGWAGEVGKPSAEVSLMLHELKLRKIGRIFRENDDEILIISPRMRREDRKLRLNRKRQKKHYDKTHSEQPNADPNALPNTNITGRIISHKSESESEGRVKKKILLSDSCEVGLAESLWNRIKTRNPSHKAPDIQAWARSFDLMLRVDKRSPVDIAKMIAWCQDDPFWQNNILSPDKLRTQFDQLTLKRNAPQVQANKPPPFPPANDPIARNSWRQAYGDPRAYGYQ